MPTAYYLLAPDLVFLFLHTFIPHGFITYRANTELLAAQHDALEHCLPNHVWWRTRFSISNHSHIYVWSYCASPAMHSKPHELCLVGSTIPELLIRLHAKQTTNCYIISQCLASFSTLTSSHTGNRSWTGTVSRPEFEERWTPESMAWVWIIALLFLREAFWVSVLSSAKWWYL